MPLTSKNMDSLMVAIEQQWTNMSKSLVRKICKSFRPRVEAMIKAADGHIEGSHGPD